MKETFIYGLKNLQNIIVNTVRNVEEKTVGTVKRNIQQRFN